MGNLYIWIYINISWFRFDKREIEKKKIIIIIVACKLSVIQY